ncbi:beta-1,4-galactosyltransferase 7 [Condylostylus longicornis]|uniref:beta-1,4-galactosyltransferase 7 n=1 Tax=Condylostylus longicornis TaxID=2530218 RepID=UPI00244E44AB|nr:beta-1,4-galactosyltransferase 7 [Condylostylus longicornis]
MQGSLSLKSFLIYGLILCFTISLIFGIFSFTTECNCDNTQTYITNDNNNNERMKSAALPQAYNSKSKKLSSASDFSLSSSNIKKNVNNKYKLAILVPFRDRFEELLQFVPHMTKFLKKQSIQHHIFILNQIDRLRFNRASLINIGFLYTKYEYDYIAMHDVDLLPLNDNLLYEYPEHGPLHIASPDFHPKYHYPNFVGGILLIKKEHFELLNGMSNKYWGWGLEDDEFFVRIKNAGLIVTRPKNITTGPNNTFNHIHDRNHRKRDTEKCFNQREITRRRDRETGLNTTKYQIENIQNLTIDEAPLTVLSIKLSCDRNITPWCDCSGNKE